MLIDGRKVLYSVKAKKVVYPEIPTEGLVCYLDARGKTNNDKHKGTLIDLSGNGNHGTLQNFGFNEESGYVKGLSVDGASGLQFDGVDDRATISRDFSFNKKPFTYLIDFEIPKTAVEQNSRIYLGWGFFIYNGNNYIYTDHTTNNTGIYGTAPVGAGRHIFICSMGEDFTKSKYLLDGNSIRLGDTLLPDGTPANFVDEPGDIKVRPEGVKKINKLMVWDRQLTDTEIQQLMEV